MRIRLAVAAVPVLALALAGCPSKSNNTAASPTPTAAGTAAMSTGTAGKGAMTTGTAGKGAMTTTSGGHASMNEAPAAGAKGNILGLQRPSYDKTNKNWKFGVMDPGTARFDAKKDYLATVHTTLGDFTVKFYPDVAPHHVTAFINLAELGFYDDNPVHRIVKGFMMQTGDPTGQGNGGPNYHLNQEFNDKKHVRGTLSMARTMDPNGAGSQFFVMFAPAPFLDHKYTVFGEVVKGMDTVDKFEKLGVSMQEDQMHKPPAKIEKIKSIDVFTQDKGGKS